MMMSGAEDFPRTNVVVVDSDFVNLLDMVKTMKQFDYQVTIFSEADKAIEFLTNSAHDINLVIWEFHMPKINGLEALKIIGSKTDLPVVIMSEDNETDSVMQATMHGACDYVMKPIRETVIANIWQHIVRKMMTKPDVAQVVQPDLAQSHGLEQANNNPNAIDGGQNIDIEVEAANMSWADLELPYEPELGNNSLFLDNDEFKIICQDIGEQNIVKEEQNAAKKPRKMSTKSNQSVQSNVVRSDGMELDNNGEETMTKKAGKKPRKPRMSWTPELHDKFLDAIEIGGGIQKTNPTLILKYLQEMNIKELARTKVASHLQKHRLNLKGKKIPKTAYRPLSLLGSSNAHTPNGRSTMHGSSSVLGKRPIGQSTYGSSSLLGQSSIGRSTTYGSSSLLGPTIAHTEFDQSNAYRPSSLLGPTNAHTEIGQSNAYRPSSLLPTSKGHTEIGQSTAYGDSSLIDLSNTYNAMSLMNGQEMNQMNQNQYPSGYLTTNNNQFMANQLPSLPDTDQYYHHLPQQQQQQQQPQQQQQQPQQQQHQQYQFPSQMNYVMNTNEPEQAYGTGNELIYLESPIFDPNEFLLDGNIFNQQF